MPQGSSLWFLLIVVGISILQAVIRKTQEQSAKKQQREAMDRRKYEEVRTGRPSQTVDQAAEQERRQRLAAARQARLRELRRQAESRQTGGRGSVRTDVGTAQAPTRATGPRTAPVARPVPAPDARTMRTGQGSTRSGQQRGAGQTARRQPTLGAGSAGGAGRGAGTRQTATVPAVTPRAGGPIQPALSKPIAEAAAIPDMPEAGERRDAPSHPVIRNLSSPEDWRRAIALREILGPPVSLREE